MVSVLYASGLVLELLALLAEERGPDLYQWAPGGTQMRALETHTTHGIQWWVANPRQI